MNRESESVGASPEDEDDNLIRVIRYCRLMRSD